MDFTHTWLPFIYLYGLGGILFIAGIIITIKSGSFDLNRKAHKKWMWVIGCGFVWYIMMHALMTWADLDNSSAYTVPIVLLGMVVVLIIVTLKLRKVKEV